MNTVTLLTMLHRNNIQAAYFESTIIQLLRSVEDTF